MKGLRLLLKGYTQAEVSREVGVSRTSVKRWADQYERGGQSALQRSEREGRRSKLDAGEKTQLTGQLIQGARASGFSTDLWTLKRVASVIKKQTGKEYTQAGVWFLLRELGFSNQRPVRKAIQL